MTQPPQSPASATLIPLTQVPPGMVEELLDRAFGEDRHQRTAYRVREGTEWLPALSFAALDEEEYCVGTIQAWPVALTDLAGRAHPMLMVGPVAVVPEKQDMGYGRALMAALFAGLDHGQESDRPPLPQMLIGDPEYYSRFGFSADHTAGWRLPGPYEQRRLLARAANPAILPREGMFGPWRGQAHLASPGDAV